MHNDDESASESSFTLPSMLLDGHNVKNTAGGSYYHFGIEAGIHSKMVEFLRISQKEEVSIKIHIDGLPLFKSSNKQFWPILGMVEDDVVKEPFVIGLYFGSRKPSSALEYLHDFVEEAKVLHERDITPLCTKIE